MKNKTVLAIDCGGSFIKYALINGEGKILEHNSTPTGKEKGVENFLENFSSLILKYKKEIEAVGVGFAGPLDPVTGVIYEATNFSKDFCNLEFVSIMKKRCELPVFLENDANVAGLGEYWIGKGKTQDVFVTITLGTGIGGGIVIGGKIWNGASGIAGEIGHICISEDGPLCGCGNRGCLETYASSTAVSRMAKKYFPDIENISGKKVYEKALEGNSSALAIFNKVGLALGKGISIISHVLGPNKIILTGGGSKAWDFFYKDMISTLEKYTFKKEIENLSITASKLDGKSGVFGAAYLALQNIQKYFTMGSNLNSGILFNKARFTRTYLKSCSYKKKVLKRKIDINQKDSIPL